MLRLVTHERALGVLWFNRISLWTWCVLESHKLAGGAVGLAAAGGLCSSSRGAAARGAFASLPVIRAFESRMDRPRCECWAFGTLMSS